jgi:hypothetical protein
MKSHISVPGRIAYETTSVYVDLAATVGLLVVAAVALRRWRKQRRAAARAEASFDPDVARIPGETVIMGTVEREQGASVAVRVELEQEGSEWENSGIWVHEWTETSRKVHVHPFYLRHASGLRIRVEPDGDVMLVDEMDGVIRLDLARRVRVAELSPGERIFAVGELRVARDAEASVWRGGYHDEKEGFVLVPPRGRRMLLSSEPLGERFARRAAFHRSWGVVALVAAITVNILTAPVIARCLLGETVDARVAHLRRYEGSGGEDRAIVMAVGARGFVFTGDVSAYEVTGVDEGDTIEVRHVPWWDFATVIDSDSIPNVTGYLALPLLGFIALIYWARRYTTRPWYEKEKLIERVSGKLAESLGAVHGGPHNPL